VAVPKVYMAEPKVRVFDLILAYAWVVMAGPKVYMDDHKVHVLEFILF
jgi:hypothetical protein